MNGKPASPHREHPNDATLLQIKTQMGPDADLLRYLPLEKVRLERFRDIKCERSTALPVKLHFGQTPNGRFAPKNVAILLCVPSGEDKTPEQQYNVFTRVGKLEKMIGVAEAIRTATYASSFACIKGVGRMDSNHLRSVAKYYFIALRVDMPTLWPVDATFIKHLTAACRLARAKLCHDRGMTSSQLDDLNMEDQAAARVLMPHQGGDEGTDSTEQNGEQGGHIVASPEAHTVPPMNSNAHGENYRTPGPDLAAGSHKTSFLERLYGPSPPPSNASDQTTRARVTSGELLPTSPTYAENATSSAGHMEPVDTAQMFSLPQSTQANLEKKKTFDIIGAYREIMEETYRNAQRLESNLNALAAVKEEIEAKQMQLDALQKEEQEIVSERERCSNRKKRLRQSLSEREQDLLDLGMELERQKINKRARND